MASEIDFYATVYKVQTLVDHGIRLTLDLPETAIMQMAMLAECQRFGQVLSITCKTEVEQKYATVEAGPKRKSEWQAKEKTSID